VSEPGESRREGGGGRLSEREQRRVWGKKNTVDKLEYLIEVCIIRLQFMFCLKPLIPAFHNAVGVTFALSVCVRVCVCAMIITKFALCLWACVGVR
jgi:hypothetical protein